MNPAPPPGIIPVAQAARMLGMKTADLSKLLKREWLPVYFDVRTMTLLGVWSEDVKRKRDELHRGERAGRATPHAHGPRPKL